MSHMRKEIHRLTYAAMFLALGILLPMAFHSIPNSGRIFLPMHIPALLAGFLLGPFYGLFVGAMSPLLSTFLTGMPALGSMPGMVLEVGSYGLLSGFFYRLMKTRNETFDIFLTLFLSLLIGKGLKGMYDCFLYLSEGNSYSWAIFSATYFIEAWPGLILQVILIPSLLSILRVLGFLTPEDRFFFAYKQRNVILRKEAAFFNEKAKNDELREGERKNKFQEGLLSLPFNKEDTILEVGSGLGEAVNFLSEQGYKIIGIDLAHEQIARAKQFFPMSSTQFLSSSFEDMKEENAYDVLLLLNTYPHFLDYRFFAQKARRLLKKNGKIYIVQEEKTKELNHLLSKKDKNHLSRNLSSPFIESLPFLFHFKRRKDLEKDVKFPYCIILEKRK